MKRSITRLIGKKDVLSSRNGFLPYLSAFTEKRRENRGLINAPIANRIPTWIMFSPMYR
ncbi:hypothetical protein SacN8_08705 [Sulfolobus acidocaldarius N8]|uniref:Uncharacterized protein n=1 Tax=Sulfolobus acidocaldarius N8 TaxID=1028566 RepID=M1IX51_9CREN|nr:hypothetical protein SacN8_08705 [Sulfolobus acidocaldarius N8]